MTSSVHTSCLMINGIVIDTLPTSGWNYFFWKTGLRFFGNRIHKLNKSDLEEIIRVKEMWKDCLDGHEEDYNCCPLDDDERQYAEVVLKRLEKIKQALDMGSVAISKFA